MTQNTASQHQHPGHVMRRLRHAVADMRLGWPVLLAVEGESAAVIPADLLAQGDTPPGPAGRLLAGRGEMELWLAANRAAVLKLAHKGRSFVAVRLERGWRPREVASLVDPTRDLAWPWKGPFARIDRPAAYDRVADAVFALLRGAGRLPAALLLPGEDAKRAAGEELVTLSDAELAAAACPPQDVVEIARARLPLTAAPDTRIVAFRPHDGGPEHFALLINDPLPHEPVLVRVHSECFTGDHLGSLKCDCGDQLEGALARLARERAGGVLLYLAQEGRGIGLVAKLKAYALQDQGFDTIEANERLGFAAEHRDFAIAAAILKRLGYERIRLLTNNPAKVTALEQAGIAVIERVPHRFPARPENARYLATKRSKAGHDL